MIHINLKDFVRLHILAVRHGLQYFLHLNRQLALGRQANRMGFQSFGGFDILYFAGQNTGHMLEELLTVALFYFRSILFVITLETKVAA
ncbi:hypothetical protein D3C85_1769230 [compost metagenome]